MSWGQTLARAGRHTVAGALVNAGIGVTVNLATSGTYSAEVWVAVGVLTVGVFGVSLWAQPANDSSRPSVQGASIGKTTAGRDNDSYFDYSTSIHQRCGVGNAEYVLIVAGAVPRQASHFVDRAQSAQLREAVWDNRVVLVCGARGVGKTQVAAAYARKVIDAGRPGLVRPGLVGWGDAGTHSSTVTGLASIAARLRVADSDGDSLVSAHLLRDHLNSRPRLAGVLVFDNATDPDFLQEFLPTRGRLRVVITSTDRALAGLGRTVDIADGFDRPQSVQYLRESTGLDDQDGADAVAAEVGDLPLALSVAAATITGRRLDYSEYRRLLAAQPLPAALPRQGGSGYTLVVDRAVDLAVDTVTAATGDEAVDERVRWLLGVMAMLSPAGVEAALLEDPDHHVRTAIARCVEGSLVSWSANWPVLVMHRLTARVIRDHARTAGTLDTLAATAAAVLTPHLFDDFEAMLRRAEGARLIGHIETLSDIIDQQPAVSADTHATVLGMRRWATLQLIEADSNRAVPMAERTYTDHIHHLGPYHPDTLDAGRNLVYAYSVADRITAAVTLCEQLFTDCKRVLGADHPDTLRISHDLVDVYQEAGRSTEATALMESSLADWARVLGSDHPLTENVCDDLAAERISDDPR